MAEKGEKHPPRLCWKKVAISPQQVPREQLSPPAPAGKKLTLPSSFAEKKLRTPSDKHKEGN